MDSDVGEGDKYAKKASLRQSPIMRIDSAETPCWKAQEAPPLRKLWPEKCWLGRDNMASALRKRLVNVEPERTWVPRWSWYTNAGESTGSEGVNARAVIMAEVGQRGCP